MIKKKAFFTIFFIVLLSYSYSQENDFEYGDVSIENLKKEFTDIDSNASAFVIFEITDISFNDIHKHIRIKIFNSNSFDLADISIPYINKFEEVEFIRGASYNLVDGKIEVSEVPIVRAIF